MVASVVIRLLVAIGETLVRFSDSIRGEREGEMFDVLFFVVLDQRPAKQIA